MRDDPKVKYPVRAAQIAFLALSVHIPPTTLSLIADGRD